jgi:hypothetical protein
MRYGDVEAHGPLFDGRAHGAVREFLTESTRQAADEGVALVRTNLGRVLKHPTGYYASRVRADQVSGGRVRVWDSGVVYGPWLEGVGERNRTTRFKGYATFRRTTQQLQARAGGIAQAVLRRYLGRMG